MCAAPHNARRTRYGVVLVGGQVYPTIFGALMPLLFGPIVFLVLHIDVVTSVPQHTFQLLFDFEPNPYAATTFTSRADICREGAAPTRSIHARVLARLTPRESFRYNGR
ncbi:hypothetical protein BDZ89DRAFT_1137197 [Hymenopellis radicata]|nr:hypothetical protein BDZ89DRAFT_1137197 [Hymenopellis radicata]